MAGVISGTTSSPTSSSLTSSSSSSVEAGGGVVEDEATDLGLRTSYSTVVVFFFFGLEVSRAPGSGAGSGLEGIYCNRDRNVQLVNRLSLINCVTHR